MADWPVTLPQILLLNGYAEAPANTALRTTMDAGPAKVRRRFTAGVRPISGQILVTGVQLETLKTFYNITIQSGALRFNWVEPLDGVTSVEMRFTAEPNWVPISGIKLQVSLDLEILP